MGRRGVEVVIQLLDVLPVIALGSREPEQPLLENRIALVPQGEREREATLIVADAEQAVLASAVGATAGLVMGEVFPAIAVGRVVLPHRSPLALG